MLTAYHRLITLQALENLFSVSALEVVVTANLAHAFALSREYIERNRLVVRQALQAGESLPARQALGRLTHAAQDFYAHSNYIPRWLDRFPPGQWPPAQEVDPFDESLLQPADLRSGKIYWPLEPFSWIPGVGRWVVPLLPRDSHAWMNLDSPMRGPAFAYAFAAAVKRTRHEYVLTTAGLPVVLTTALCG